MKVRLILAIALIGLPASAQIPGKKSPALVERLCGKLEYTEDFSVKGSPSVFETKTRSLRGVNVSLYAAEADGAVSYRLPAISQTTTNHWGNFRLKEKRLAAGLYWVVVEPSGRKYEMLIRYEPKRDSRQLCSDSFWQLNDDGNFWRAERIFVD